MIGSLTNRQREILEFLVNFLEENGYQPSYREIGKHFKIKSTRGISDHIEALRRKGYLDKDPSRARSITITKLAEINLKSSREPSVSASSLKESISTLGEGIRRLFLKVGYAVMGNFQITNDDNDTSYAFDQNLVAGENTFLIRAKGDSMINAHIQDGDLIMINPDYPNPDNGDIIAARLDDEATVKRFYREDNNLIRLQPENESLSPIYVRPENGNFNIIGKVVGIFRQI